MGILLSKNLKQKQSIKLTPSLKKSIDLLQLSRFELIKKIENEIIENPFLEKQDYDYDNSFNEKDFDFDIASKLTLRETLLDQLNDSNKATQLSPRNPRANPLAEKDGMIPMIKNITENFPNAFIAKGIVKSR